MPRRSRSAAHEESSGTEAKRTTRGSIAKPEEPAARGRGSRRSGRAATKQSTSPSPSRQSTPSPVPVKRASKPAAASSSRPKRASASRGRGSKAAESEEESDPEEEEEEEFVPTTPKGGRLRGRAGKATPPTRGRSPRAAKSPATSRSKRRKVIEVDSDEDEDEDWEQEQVEVKKATPVKSASGRPQRARRGGAVLDEPEPVESPSRRSSRRASKAASACIEAQVAEEDGGEEAPVEADAVKEEAGEDSPKKKPVKRGIEEVEEDMPAEKKARVDEADKDVEMDKAEEDAHQTEPEIVPVSEAEAEAETEPMDDNEEAAPEIKEKVAEVTEEVSEVAEEVPEVKESMDCDTEEEDKTDAPQASVEAEVAEPEKEADPVEEKDVSEATSKKNEVTLPEEAVESSIQSEDVEMEEKVDSTDEEKEPEACEAANKEGSQAASSAAEEVANPTPSQEPSSSKPGDTATEVDISEYVVISKADVPDAESDQVKESLPEEPAADINEEQMPEEPSSSSPDVTSNEASPTENNVDQAVSTSSEVADSTAEEKAASSQADSSSGHIPQQPAVSSSSNGLPSSSEANEISDINSDCVPTSNCHGEGGLHKAPSLQGPLFSRELVFNPQVDRSAVDKSKTFSLVSYNILADCHAQRDYTYDGVWIGRDQLALTYRHNLLMKELQYLDADVVCLQEVGPDHFHKMLVPSFRELGYEGEMIKRADDVHNEGEATFYRSSRFELVANRGIELAAIARKELELSGLEPDTMSAVRAALQSPSVAMLTQLRCRNSSNTVSIANVHNMWDRFARQDLQCIMIASAIKELVNMAAGPDQPHVICGDFNSWPGSAVYQLTQEGYLNDSSMAALNNAPTITVSEDKDVPLVNLWWKGFQHTSSFKSAYASVMEREPISSKFPHDGVMRAVDFIWYAGLEAVAVAKMNSSDLIKSGVPNEVFPSDHLSVKALFSLK